MSQILLNYVPRTKHCGGYCGGNQGKKINHFPSRWRWDLVAGAPEEELMNEKDWRK